MIHIKLSHNSHNLPLLRQTPGYSGIWQDCFFYVNQPIKECDWWVVYEGLLDAEETICDPDHLIFITGEPPEIRGYNKKFLEQFSLVITAQANIKHRNILVRQQALPWHIGLRRQLNGNISALGYDDFIENDRLEKNSKKLMSIIVSTKSYTDGHKKRLKFVEELVNHFGDHIDLFGRGFNEIEDKWRGISPYKYHVAIENSYVPDYFSEKLADAFLGLSYPIYYGCPNIFDYFPKLSLTPIDIENPAKSILTIEELIKEDAYRKRFAYLKAAKNLVLNQYNLFPMLAAICNKSQKERRKITIKPENNSAFDNPTEKLRKFVRHLRTHVKKAF